MTRAIRLTTRFTIGAAAVVLAGTPALAQVDLSGTWNTIRHEDLPDRGPGVGLGDYTGIPLTDAARQWAESWDASRLTMLEQQCRVHASPYIYRGPLNVRIWEDKDPKTQEVIAIKHYISTYEQTRTIWMDGRPHPPDYAPHTWMGFSTGRWDGDRLTVRTTHIKQGWIRRNGVPMSDRARMTEYIVKNGDMMTHAFVLIDPVYLAEPLVKSEEFFKAPRELPAGTWLWVCEPVVEIATQNEGDVPAYLPGEHPFKGEFESKYRVPEIAVRGGPETMYPEFQSKVAAERAKMPPARGRGAGPGPAGRGGGPAQPGRAGGGRGQ